MIIKRRDISNYSKIIYGNLRDFLITEYNDTYYQVVENDFFPQEMTRDFYLLNNVYSIFKGRQDLIYIKLSHIIENKQADVYEFFDLKYNHTIKISLRNNPENSLETLNITIVGEDLKLRKYNITNLYNYSKFYSPRFYDHFYFRFGLLSNLTLYPFRFKYYLLIFVLILILLLLFYLDCRC